MTAISDAELHQVFQREYPKDLARTTEGESPSEYDLDRIEAEKLAGERWEDIRADRLQELFDIASWLPPERSTIFFRPSSSSLKLMLIKPASLWTR